ncbi:putative ATP-dependent RNA helicase TDRD12 [Chamaea fasciata]|uniref:putative ATP-dependent RNA helicase TDRD12 n=1 Tax=Chamaea fasciata TaxID=190680 RepID=UPI00336A0E4D
MEVVVLKVEDPSCFWIAVKEHVPGVFNETVYENLNAEMKQFYSNYKDAEKIKGEKVEKGQVYVVFSEELKCWCRAVVESVWCQTDGYQLGCFLVDYAKSCSVASENIRVLAGAFAEIPPRAKKCRLHCTRPLTLHIDYCENTAKIGPAKRWDTAAIQHFRKLLEEATEVKATIQAIEDKVLEVFLYVTIRDEKVCVNDDLVAKHFAHYKESKGTAGSSSDDSDHEVSVNAECVPVEFVGPTFLARPKLPFGEAVSPHLGPGLDGCNSVLGKTSQRLCAIVNDNTLPVVSMVPALPSKEDKAVQTERLPQFLNSSSFQTYTVEDEQQSFQNVGKEKNFVFLSKKIEPSSVLETAPLFDGLKKELAWNKFSGPTFTESYCWPAVALGCDVVAVSHQGKDPLLYIPPVLTLLQLKSDSQALPNRSGPQALILCPGWKKVQLVFDLLKTYRKGCRQLHPVLIILGQNKEAASQVEIRGCKNTFLTTPHNLLRLLEYNTGLLCKLCHLVLDEVEVLFSDAAEQVFTILGCYKEATAQAQGNLPHQIIAVGTQWNKHITPLINEFMNDPHIVITAVEEAAIFGNVQQVVQPCMSSSRTAELLKILDFTQRNLQKVLVIADSVTDVEMIHKALKSNSVVSLKKHKESKCNAQCVLERWRKMHSRGTPAVLVLTDDCLQSLGITDATCVIHFSFPSPGVFGQRLQSLSDNFCAGIKDSAGDQEHTKAKSVILLTESSSCHAPGILCYLKRAEAEIPEELYDLTPRVLESEEDKFSRPLCTSLKTFGICRNRTECPDRHQVNSSIDMAQNVADEMIETPESVTILPLLIVHATNYFGRIVKKQKDQYTALAKEMNDYFKVPEHRISVDGVEKSVFYGFCEGAICHRVQVVETPAKDEENVCKVTVKYIDEGRTSQVNSDQLLHLPAKFQNLPPQAVEIVVCRVKPIDNEVEWNPKVTDHINHKIKGKLHHAKVVHTLGNTVWVDPMVGITRLPVMKMWINEYNIRSEILSTGLGTDNPEHIGEIQKLCRQVPVLHHAERLEHLSTKEDTAGLEEVSSPQDTSIQANSAESCNSSGTSPSNDAVQTKEAEDSTVHQQKGCHPQIKWFQDNVTVTLKVQILRAADSKCEFSREKVAFRAYSEGKLYVADLELYQSVIAEKSTCVIKDTEAVILLVKEKKGAWCKLLKNKNVHVSLDFEHWEESEDERPFTVGSGKLSYPPAGSEDWFESSEDSDTESDE